MTLLELLQQGRVEEFNASRGRHAAPDLFGADFSKASLRGVDLSGANLEKADLSGADLGGAMLAGANLSGADLTSTNLAEVVAPRSRWRDAWLGGAILDGAECSRADFTGAGLPGLRAVGARFSNARFRDADLSAAFLQDAHFDQANLSSADLNRAVLMNASFVEANLQKANLDEAIAEGADFSLSRMGGLKARGARMRRCNLRSADLSGADLCRADLSEADLSRADLTECNLDETVLREADLRDARLEGTDIGRADTRDARLDARGGAPSSTSPDPALRPSLRFEEPAIAVSGDTVGVLWENEDIPGQTRLRLACGILGQPWDGASYAFSESSESVVSKAILPNAMGFSIVLFVSRPGGMICRLTEVSAMGDIGTTRTLPFEYVHAVKPMFLADPDGFSIVGLSRSGPTLQVHRFDGDRFVQVFKSRVPTARGFIGREEPVIVCKGGVVIPVSASGLGLPLRCPEGLPGRQAVACRDGADLLLAWLSQGEQGLRLARSRAGAPMEIVTLHANRGVSSLDVAHTEGRTLLACTLEGESLHTHTTLHGTLFPDMSSACLFALPGQDLEDVHVLATAPRLLLATCGSEGSLRVLEMEGLVATERLVMLPVTAD